MGRVFIIAEAGVNHNGDPALAHKLTEMAAWCGADAVKFQTFRASGLVSTKAPLADYQSVNMKEKVSQYDMLKKLELSSETFRELKTHAEELGLEFLSSPFDHESIRVLNELGLETFKIPSGEITNMPYLREIGSLGKRVILSTGMADIREIEAAIEILTLSGTSRLDIALLHATTEYPAPFDEVNLRAIVTLRETFGLRVGYSDHTPGIEVPIAASALGAEIIEKHFTLDQGMEGPDHKASLQAERFRDMVVGIRNIELAMGTGVKEATPSEKKNIPVVRKSIHYNGSFEAGHILKSGDLIMKRPGTGISPMMADNVTGRKLRHNVVADTIVLWEDLL